MKELHVPKEVFVLRSGSRWVVRRYRNGVDITTHTTYATAVADAVDLARRNGAILNLPPIENAAARRSQFARVGRL